MSGASDIQIIQQRKFFVNKKYIFALIDLFDIVHNAVYVHKTILNIYFLTKLI